MDIHVRKDTPQWQTKRRARPAKSPSTLESMKTKRVTRNPKRKRASSLSANELHIKMPVTNEASNGTLSQRVYLALKKDIITGQYQPGEALSEKELAKRYHGSRTPVREAAARLQHEHLVRIVANRGYFITQISFQWVNEIYEFRAAVEGASAELAAQKSWDQATLDHMLDLANTERKVDDRASYMRFIEADTEFHIAIAKLTRNPLLIRAVADMRSQMERIMYASIEAGYYGELPVSEHCGIVEAIQNRDPALARKRMCDHIYISKDKVLRLASGSSRL